MINLTTCISLVLEYKITPYLPETQYLKLGTRGRFFWDKGTVLLSHFIPIVIILWDTGTVLLSHFIPIVLIL